MNSKRAPRRGPSYDLFIGNIPAEASEHDVAKLFSCFGEISYLSLREGHRNDGTKIAFIHYLNEQDAEQAIKERAGHMWDGMQLIVCKAQKKNETKTDEPAGPLLLGQGNKTLINKKPFPKDNLQGDVHQYPADKVLVTHVEDSCTFWAQSVQDSNKNAEIMDMLFEICGNAKPITGKPVIRQVYATVYSLDNNWYRCTILQHITEEKSLVKYIDYGNAEIIENFKILNLPEEISCVPPLAQRYRLNHLFLKKDNLLLLEEGTKFLKDTINDKIVIIRKIKTDRYLTYVDASIDTTLLNEEVLKRGYAVSTFACAMEGAEQQMPRPERDPLAYALLKDGKLPHPIRGRPVVRTDVPEAKKLDYQNIDHPFLKLDNRSGWGDHVIQQAAMEDKYKREIKLLQSHLLTCKQRLDEAISKQDFLSYMTTLSDEVAKVRKFRLRFNVVDNNDWLEEAALILLDEKARVLSQNLLHLPDVKQALNHYHGCQKAIRESLNKQILDELVTERDELRRSLHASLEAFLMEIKCLPLETRSHILHDCIEKLKSNYSLYLNRESPGPVPLKNILQAYQEWKSGCFPTIKAVQMQTDSYLSTFQFKFNQLLQALTLKNGINTPLPSTAEIVECTQTLNMALRDEIEKCSKEEKQGFKVLALMATQVFNELTQECDYVKQVRHSEKEYTALELLLKPWLSEKPNLDKLKEINKSIRTLRSKLRHKLADLKDLEEENDEEQMEIVKREISEIRVKLHLDFSEQDIFLTECLPVVREHFPEYMCQHPELQTELQYDGVVKQNRELDHYDLEVISPFLWKTNSCGAFHVIKECHMDSKPKTLEFLRRLSNYEKLGCIYLSPVIAAFLSKTEREVYVQMPFYSKSLLDQTCSINKILVVVLQALKELHSNNLIHGKLTPKSVMITEDDEVVVVPNILLKMTASCKDENPQFRGLNFIAPELRDGLGIASPSSDMYSFGCLMLWLFYPNVNFVMTESGLPDLSQLPPSLNIISSLVSNVSRTRPAAYSLLQSNFFIKMTVQDSGQDQESAVKNEYGGEVANASDNAIAHYSVASDNTTARYSVASEEDSSLASQSSQQVPGSYSEFYMADAYRMSEAAQTFENACSSESQNAYESSTDSAYFSTCHSYSSVEQTRNTADISNFYSQQSVGMIDSDAYMNMNEYAYVPESAPSNENVYAYYQQESADVTYIPEYAPQSSVKAAVEEYSNQPLELKENEHVSETVDQDNDDDDNKLDKEVD